MVDEFKLIDVMNDARLKLLKDNNKDYEENLKIKKLLNDKALFFKISKSRAYNILELIGIKQKKIEDVYNKLINQDIFYNLLNRGVINIDDPNLVVKYKVYNKDDLFKKKN